VRQYESNSLIVILYVAWHPRAPRRLMVVTTGDFSFDYFVKLAIVFQKHSSIIDSEASRMYRLEFDDITRPLQGGTIVVSVVE
jgi:hypothetical protein